MRRNPLIVHSAARLQLGILTLGVALGGAACGGDNKTTDTPADVSASATVSTTGTPPTMTSAIVDPGPQLPPVDFVAGNPATPPDKAPSVAFKSPKKDELISSDKAANYEVKLDVKGWDVPTDHKHVHLILDGLPYKRIDDIKAPIKLSELNKRLTDGQHVLAAFPSRGTHESVKPIGKNNPLAVVAFYIGAKKGDAVWKPTDPTMIFSRPKGQNNGKVPDEGLLVDFYLDNVELGDGKFSIDATVSGPGIESGKEVHIKEWRPFRITNIRDGQYNIHMALLDKDGKPVPGAWNDVTRDFSVDSKAAPDHPPPAADAGPPPAALPPKK